MTQRALCIHGHFYQPSREDPLTGVIPNEIGADPYKNWNERINATCYAPNAAIGNFEKISFNLGPTLTRWMDGNSTPTLDQIVISDQYNLEKFDAGNAMAQPYHHTILPLASRLDKTTQVKWGIADFEHTFGHTPEGMWLPEAAVDLETLEVLAENEIRFTILAPWQADCEKVDVTHPYRVNLPGGKSIAVFFYHSGLSTSISFDPASTINANYFIEANLSHQFSNSDVDQLLIVASDGELYGHHQPFRDKFLNYLLNGALHQAEIDYTTPARWLMDHTPVEEINIREMTSWSCSHGVERWRGECGCTPNGSWKQAMREFLNLVSEKVDQAYQEETKEWLHDPLKSRDDYIHVLLGEQDFTSWKAEQTTRPLIHEESLILKQLLTAQVERQRMFTSCGLFFDDFDRIEPRNNILYAAHSVALTEQATGKSLTGDLIPVVHQLNSWKTSLRGQDVFFDALRRFRQQNLMS